MTPTEKLQLMREAQINPGIAFLHAMEIIRTEMKSQMDIELAKIEAQLPEKVVLKHIEKLKGDPGNDAEPVDTEAVIKSVFDKVKPLIPEAPAAIKPTSEELIALILPHIPKVEDGKTPTETELKKIILPMIPPPVEQDILTEDDVKNIVLGLLPEDDDNIDIEAITQQIINSIEARPIPASRITGLPRISKTKNGKYHHGGGDTVFAGSNITITVNADGTKTISSTGGGGTWYQDEVPDGLKNGSNKIYTLAHAPTSVVFLYLNGQYLASGGVDYTRSGTGITMVVAPLPTDSLIATYS